MPGIEFKAFKASNSRVKLLSFHPTEPWLAFADKGHQFGVLNWMTHQVVLDAQVGLAEEICTVEAALQKLAEKDPSFYGPASTAPIPKLVSPGTIRDLCFVDLETCFWQIAQQQHWQFRSHSGNNAPQIGKARELRAHRWLVAACEAKVLLKDLSSSAVIDVPRAVFESRTPSCVAVLYVNSPSLLAGADAEKKHAKEDAVVSPIIAVGTSSGVTYLLALRENQCHLVAKLVGGSKAGVTRLLAIGGQDATSPERLVSASADGSVALWDPSFAVTASSATSKDLSPAATTKPHDSEIVSMVVASFQSDSPDSAPLRLVTCGEDKKVAIIELPNLARQVARWKPLAKGALDGLAFNPWGPPGTQLLAISGERPAIWTLPLDGRQTEAQVLISLDSFLPAGTKKSAKVYTIAAHPLRPDVIAVGANAGIGILAAQGTGTVPAAALPAEQASFSGRQLEYLYASETSLWRLSYRAAWSLVSAERQLIAEPVNKASIAKLRTQGAPEVTLSPDGRHCSLVWPEACQFAIYSSSSPEIWQEVKSGTGLAVAWSPNGNLLAILHLPQVQYPEFRRGKTKKGKAKEEEASIHAASVAASLAAQEGGHVKIYSLSGTGGLTEQTSASSQLTVDRPQALFGGPVLGISSGKRIARGHRRGSSLHFYSWATGKAVSGEMLAPAWLAWERGVSAVALAYPDAIVLCRAQPRVEQVATLPIQSATSGVWHHRLLLVSSFSEIHGIFVAAGQERKPAFIESVKLAALEGGVVSQLAGDADSTTSLPSESMRCGGPCAIGGIRDGVLWLVDSRGSPFIIPLAHAGLRARIAAAQGDASAARAVAESGLSKAHHDEIASFIAAMVPTAGISEALSLSGISIQMEMELSRKAGKFRRALRCLQALALGATDSAAFKDFPAWTTHLSESTPLETAPAPREPGPLPFLHLIQHNRVKSVDLPVEKPDPRRSVLAFIAADNAEAESSEDDELEEQAEALLDIAQAPTEAIDWDALLTLGKQDEPPEIRRDSDERPPPAGPADPASISATPATMPSTSQQPQEAAVSPEEGLRIARLFDQGLLLIDTALGYGHEDVAKAALRTLLRGTGSLGPTQLQALLVRCSQTNMKAEIQSFAARIVKDGTGASPATSSLVAALVDNPSLAHSTLRASGMVPLSAIYSHTWKHGNSLQDINDWGSYLTAAAGNSIQFAVVPPTI